MLAELVNHAEYSQAAAKGDYFKCTMKALVHLVNGELCDLVSKYPSNGTELQPTFLERLSDSQRGQVAKSLKLLMNCPNRSFRCYIGQIVYRCCMLDPHSFEPRRLSPLGALFIKPFLQTIVEDFFEIEMVDPHEGEFADFRFSRGAFMLYIVMMCDSLLSTDTESYDETKSIIIGCSEATYNYLRHSHNYIRFVPNEELLDCEVMIMKRCFKILEYFPQTKHEFIFQNVQILHDEGTVSPYKSKTNPYDCIYDEES